MHLRVRTSIYHFRGHIYIQNMYFWISHQELVTIVVAFNNMYLIRLLWGLNEISDNIQNIMIHIYNLQRFIIIITCVILGVTLYKVLVSLFKVAETILWCTYFKYVVLCQSRIKVFVQWKSKYNFILATDLCWKVCYAHISDEKIVVLRADECFSRKSNEKVVEQGFKHKPPIISSQ